MPTPQEKQQEIDNKLSLIMESKDFKDLVKGSPKIGEDGKIEKDKEHRPVMEQKNAAELAAAVEGLVNGALEGQGLDDSTMQEIRGSVVQAVYEERRNAPDPDLPPK